MRTFDYLRPGNVAEVETLFRPGPVDADPLAAPAQFLGGGTTMVDLMKLYVMRPETLVDIKQLPGLDTIEPTADGGLRLGALVTMAQAARDERLCRDYRMAAEALRLAASTQLRNMARLGGNVLQRTRCNYFRDVSYPQCNKRAPGSGCAALDGQNRKHAVLGVGAACIASYPGDFAQALMALDATLTTTGPLDGQPFARLHRLPGDTPHIETRLAPGELITGFVLPPAAEWTRRSTYVKIRDRDSYAFALASAAVGLALADGGKVAEVRIGLGGVATVPWRARQAEDALRGQPLTEATATAAAAREFAAAATRRYNRHKIALGQGTLVRALLTAQTLEI